jgi:hypothetical protein
VAGTIFNNSGQIIIGSTVDIGADGINNGGEFNNNSDGEIIIDRVNFDGIRNFGGTFANAGQITVSNTTATGDDGIFNGGVTGTFVNEYCGIIVLNENLRNSDDFTNDGVFTVNTDHVHSNTSLTNTGVIVYPQGNPIPNVTNNQIIVAPISGGCTIADALQVGGLNNFFPAADWYADEALSVPAGNYDYTDNTFTATDLTAGTHTLYFEVIPDACGPAVVSIQVTLNANCSADSDGDGIPDEDDNCPDDPNPGQEDSDCDTVGDACDVCPGGDDSVDNNNDGLPDCKYPPAYAQIIAAWKCGSNKVYVCHNGNTICINKNALAAHIAHGDYLGPCHNADCDDDCDGIGNACDLCPGGDDAVDNNNNNQPDCHYPPSYNQIIAAWKCGANKAYVCHEGQTLCVNKNQIDSYICQGAYLGPCDNATCEEQARGGNSAEDRQESGETTVAQEVALYPNPASNEAWLDLSAFEGGAFIVLLLDVRGALVREVNVAEASDEPLRLDLSGIAAGLYFVHLQPEGEEAKVVKLMVETRH